MKKSMLIIVTALSFAIVNFSALSNRLEMSAMNPACCNIPRLSGMGRLRVLSDGTAKNELSPKFAQFYADLPLRSILGSEL